MKATVLSTTVAAALSLLFQSALALPTDTNTISHVTARDDGEGEGSFMIPEGSPDGLYIGAIDADGSPTLEYLGPGPADSANTSTLASRDSPSAHGETLYALEARAPTGVYCQTWLNMNTDDRSSANSALIKACGSGGLYFSSKSIASVRGSAIAYGCNYGNGQTCYGRDLDLFFLNLGFNCGLDKAAWWSQQNWKASYGYTVSGQKFC